MKKSERLRKRLREYLGRYSVSKSDRKLGNRQFPSNSRTRRNSVIRRGNLVFWKLPLPNCSRFSFQNHHKLSPNTRSAYFPTNCITPNSSLKFLYKLRKQCVSCNIFRGDYPTPRIGDSPLGNFPQHFDFHIP